MKQLSKDITIMSLFGGLGTLRLAFENLGYTVKADYYSEIKPAAIELTQHHFPDTIQLGDINNWREWDIDWASVDFIGSGSPCQDLSIAGKRAGIQGEQSNLFFVFVDILTHVKKFNPDVLFLQENVGSAPVKDVGIMSEALDILPVKINSKLMVAQLRCRYYWSNIKVRTDWTGYRWTDIPQPEDRGIILKDIIESGEVNRNKSVIREPNHLKKREVIQLNTSKESGGKQPFQQNRIYDIDGIAPAMCTSNNGYILIREATKKGSVEVKQGEAVDLAYPNSKTRRGRLMKDKSNALLQKNEFYFNDGYRLRLFTQTELERLQGFPDGFTSILSYKDAESLLGDGWTLPMIEHILSFIQNK